MGLDESWLPSCSPPWVAIILRCNSEDLDFSSIICVDDERHLMYGWR